MSDIILFDVTNLSIGIKLEGNIFHKMIPRSKPIPYNTKEIFHTVNDNQTSASIEIFEGEIKNNCNLNNFLLGKFMIYGLPKRKKGEVEIEVSIHIKENSILEVTATQNDNKINSKKLTIKKVNDLPEIMNKLKQRGDIIIFFEDEKYNKVKFSIIEFEEELRKLKSKKEKNDENFKSIYKSLIEYLGGFLIKCIDISNLYISFFKYYFNKVCEFYQICKFEKEEELEKIKNHLSCLLEKIQFYNKELILEIIEEFVDVDDIYKSFMSLIMQSLWDDINTIVKLTKTKNNDKYEAALKDLSKAKSLIEICSEMIDKFDKDKIQLNNISKADLKIIGLKIEVKEKIFEYKKRGFFSAFLFNDTNSLKNLYDRYYDSLAFESEDLNELGNIIGIKPSPRKNNYTNFSVEFEKAQKFINFLEGKTEQDDIFSIIPKILNDYPYELNNAKKDKMWEEFYKLKSHQYNKYDYLIFLKMSYERIMNSGEISDIENNVFNSILEYLNKII